MTKAHSGRGTVLRRAANSAFWMLIKRPALLRTLMRLDLSGPAVVQSVGAPDYRPRDRRCGQQE